MGPRTIDPDRSADPGQLLAELAFDDAGGAERCPADRHSRMLLDDPALGTVVMLRTKISSDNTGAAPAREG
jgi:hypothetical protein